jgi:hypothetical protein
MKTLRALFPAIALGASLFLPTPSPADTLLFNNDFPDGRMASATTPGGNGFIEHESADDFLLSSGQRLTSATFTGLIPAGASIQQVVVEIYRVFPKDSDVNRTSGPPTFSTDRVPTRVNSPSDVAFASRDSHAGELSFMTNIVASSFTANNTVINGIHPKPNQTTGGEGPVTGQEVQFLVTLTSPIDLPADHYFFVPQVLLGGSSTPFLWLSAPKPITSPGTPFTPDLQSWTRDANLEPDWLRIGTDIVGGAPPPTFNAAFSVSGNAIPEPGSLVLFGIGGILALGARLRTRGGRR